QIAARLDDRFRLLSVNRRTAPPRHQTLRATLDWSYALLDELERTLFNRLSVFAGGWSMEAAEAVCCGDGVETDEIVDLLGQLIDQSLVLAQETAGRMRFQMLETIRAYAAEKLREDPLWTRVHAHHRDWYLALAESIPVDFSDPAHVAQMAAEV